MRARRGVVHEDEVEEIRQVVGLIIGKPLLTVLRGSGVDKSAEKCHLEFIEGVEPGSSSGAIESVETRLVVKLHYKHGVIKTHTFPISDTTSVRSPTAPTDDETNKLQIGGRTLKELIEHFPRSDKKSSGYSEPILIWQFFDDNVTMKTEDRWNQGKGDWIGGKAKRRAADEDDDDGTLIYSSLNSQLSLAGSEFEFYDVSYAPVTLALHLKELNATMAVAEALGTDVVVRFTSKGAPIFFTFEHALGTYSAFCALSTRIVPESEHDGERPMSHTSANTNDGRHRDTDGYTPSSSNRLVDTSRKRMREEGDGYEGMPASTRRKNAPLNHPSRSATPLDLHAPKDSRGRGIEEPSFHNIVTSTPRPGPRHPNGDAEPLFYPASQSIQPSQVLKDAGLDSLINLSQAEIQEMMIVDDEEFTPVSSGGRVDARPKDGGRMEFDNLDEAFPPTTQADSFPPTQRHPSDQFSPLFDD